MTGLLERQGIKGRLEGENLVPEIPGGLDGQFHRGDVGGCFSPELRGDCIEFRGRSPPPLRPAGHAHGARCARPRGRPDQFLQRGHVGRLLRSLQALRRGPLRRRERVLPSRALVVFPAGHLASADSRQPSRHLPEVQACRRGGPPGGAVLAAQPHHEQPPGVGGRRIGGRDGRLSCGLRGGGHCTGFVYKPGIVWNPFRASARSTAAPWSRRPAPWRTVAGDSPIRPRAGRGRPGGDVAAP
jgi:hypothetical protein